MKSIISILIISALISCASENDSLVNPPPRYETVKLRFYNLAGDNLPRTLSLESYNSLDNIPVGSVSGLIQPSADSVYLEVLQGTKSEFKTDTRFKFGRNVTYSFVGLPAALGSIVAKPIDTIITFGTSFSVSQNPNEAYIKMFNANPDSTISYSLALGCPNGLSLTNSLFYRKVSIMQVVKAGEVPLSITKRRGNEDSLVGLFNFNFAKRGQYTIIVKSSPNASEEILLLDDLNDGTSAISKPTMISERYTQIRTMNFSTEPISLKKLGGEDIIDGLIPHFIDNYTKIAACTSLSKDTIQTYISGTGKSLASTSFEVLAKYTVAIFDSASNKAARTVIAAPVVLTVDQDDKAIVRVINGNYLQSGVTVAIGARYVANSQGDDASRGFTAGDGLASRLPFGEISGYTLVDPGTLPIAVFTSTEPAKLITTARVNIEAGKEYILIVYANADGEQRVAIVNTDEQDKLIEPMAEGVFVQTVHGTAGKDFISVNFPGLFSNAKLSYSGSLATVLDAGQNTIQIDGISHTITATPQDRAMIISAGNKDQQEIFDITTPPLFSGNNYYIRRYINAAKDIPRLNVKLNDSLVIMPNINYQTRSSYEKIYQEKKFSLFFENAETEEDLARIDDLFLTYRKTFSIIFVGGKNYGGYSVILQQEY